MEGISRTLTSLKQRGYDSKLDNTELGKAGISYLKIKVIKGATIVIGRAGTDYQ